MEKISQLQCPNCKTYKVTDGRQTKKTVLIGGIVLFSFGVWIPVVGWFILMPIGVLLIIISVFVKNKAKGTCRNCSFVFDIKDEEKSNDK